MKKITSILLCIVMLATTVLLSSCSNLFARGEYNFPEGYTGGIRREPHLMKAGIYYWVETYDELVAAMELLKSHGSTFRTSVIFTYEGDLFDTKYYIYFNREKSDKIKYGDNPFDRWAEDVVVASFAFYDDVSIDELVYSSVQQYQCYTISINQYRFPQWYETNADKDMDSNDLYIEQNEYGINIYTRNYKMLLSIGGFNSSYPIPQDCLDTMIESAIVIE